MRGATTTLIVATDLIERHERFPRFTKNGMESIDSLMSKAVSAICLQRTYNLILYLGNNGRG